MKAHLLCPSTYLDVCEIDCEKVGTIRGFVREKVGYDQKLKWVILFREFSKGLVVNQTIKLRLIQLLGDETDDWIDRQVLLYPSETLVEDGGNTMPCVRVKGMNGEVFAESG